MSEDRTCEEFVCASCGANVVQFWVEQVPPTMCSTCQLLDETVADPVEREELRAILAGPP